jgi:hypothetical protein
MQRRAKEERKMVWADAEPLTRGVIAAFSGRVGSRPGDLNEIAFAASLSEAFLDVGASDVRIQLGSVGLTEVRKKIVAELQRPEAVTAVSGLIQNLNCFAGNSPAQANYWANNERDVIFSGTAEEADAVLHEMSTTAAGYISQK